ncbi:hypothetical protein FOA52_015238 [Chlamydomonas sp. UWO 241]|nr:hypothetical protein FOA52_015238 [Chlamydomonas sp. UWO 241]
MPSPIVYAVVAVEVEVEYATGKELGPGRCYPGDIEPMPHRNMANSWPNPPIATSESPTPNRLTYQPLDFYASKKAAQADAQGRRAAADAEGESAWAAWDVNKWTLTKAVVPGDVVHCVLAGDAWLYLMGAAVHVSKAQARPLFRHSERFWGGATLQSFTVGYVLTSGMRMPPTVCVGAQGCCLSSPPLVYPLPHHHVVPLSRHHRRAAWRAAWPCGLY